MYITRHSNVTDRSTVDSLWEVYTAAYAQLSALDVTREELFRDEFEALLADPANRIWVVREDNVPIAMSLIATDIGSTRYLSRAYFEKHFPERMAAGLVHYVMWVVVHPDWQASAATFHLARGGLAVEQEEGALLVFDLPDSNQPNEEGGGAELLYRLAQMVGDVSLKSFGLSRYYALDFAPAESSSPAPSEPAEAPTVADAGRVST